MGCGSLTQQYEVQERIIRTLFQVSGRKASTSVCDGRNGSRGEKKYGINKSAKSYGAYVGSGAAAIRLLSLSGISYVFTLRSSR